MTRQYLSGYKIEEEFALTVFENIIIPKQVQETEHEI